MVFSNLRLPWLKLIRALLVIRTAGKSDAEIMAVNPPCNSDCRQVRRGDHAVLPELYDGAVPPHLLRAGRPRRRHWRGCVLPACPPACPRACMCNHGVVPACLPARLPCCLSGHCIYSRVRSLKCPPRAPTHLSARTHASLHGLLA
jgi:hypothetical protein